MSIESDPSTDPIPSELREISSLVCVQCDYSLVGLPQGSRCPECGAANDPNLITLRGWSPASIATARRGQLPMFIITFLVFGALIANNIARGRRMPVVAVILLFASLLFPLFQLFRRWLAGVDSHMPVRLRLGPEGFEQRMGPGPLDLTRWHQKMVPEMKIGGHGRHTLQVKWAMGHFVVAAKSQLIWFDFDADPQHARALESQINEWIARAG